MCRALDIGRSAVSTGTDVSAHAQSEVISVSPISRFIIVIIVVPVSFSLVPKLDLTVGIRGGRLGDSSRVKREDQHAWKDAQILGESLRQSPQAPYDPAI